jgi:hypothetical protein
MERRGQKRDSIYGAFAATRLALARSQLEVSARYDPEMRFWFARFELYVAMLIMMDNWYAATADADPDARGTRLSNLISQMPCSYTKARQLIDDSAELGYARIKPAAFDHRVKIVLPTSRTIRVWQAYWDEAKAIMDDTGLVEMLVEETVAARAADAK